jgi:hypothetical protein
MDETAQIVFPPDVTLVIIFGAYICLGRKTDDCDRPMELSAKRSSGNLISRDSKGSYEMRDDPPLAKIRTAFVVRRQIVAWSIAVTISIGAGIEAIFLGTL